MPTPLVIEHFDVVEQLHLGIPVTFEALPKFALHGREEALHHRVVVAVAATTHAAGDAVLPEYRLIVLARVGASLVGMVQQTGIGAASLQRHFEGFDRQVPVVDGADRPAHDESREQVKNRGQVELAAGPDQQLRRVAYPALVGRLRLELSVQKVGCDRLIVIAQGRQLESLARSRFQPLFLHQPSDALGADPDSLLEEIPMDPRAPIAPPALVKRRLDKNPQSSVVSRVGRLRTAPRGIETARRDPHGPAQLPDREGGLLRVDPGKGYAWLLAKKAVAFFRMSRSIRSSRFSLRSCASSARSSLVSPVLPRVRSACARATQTPREEGVRSSSRATAPMVFPSSSTNRMAPALNSGVNRRRARLPADLVCILDIISTSQIVSTKAGECQAEIVGLNVGDVYIDDRTPRTRLRIRPEIAKGGRTGDVFLPDALMGKLRKFWGHKARRGEGLQPQDPLFCSQSRVRISKR